MEGRVYVVTNRVTGKQYVGQTTKSIKERWAAHCKLSRYSAHPSFSILHKSIAKHGIINFSIRAICVGDIGEKLNRLEEEAIQNYKTLQPFGYNVRQGSVCARVPGTIGYKRKSEESEGLPLGITLTFRNGVSKYLARHYPTNKSIAFSSAGWTDDEKLSKAKAWMRDADAGIFAVGRAMTRHKYRNLPNFVYPLPAGTRKPARYLANRKGFPTRTCSTVEECQRYLATLVK